jgi:hypothetical protein
MALNEGAAGPREKALGGLALHQGAHTKRMESGAHQNWPALSSG